MAELATNAGGDIGSQLRDFYRNISERQLWIIFLVVAVVIIGLGIVVYLSQQTTWVKLFTGLSPKETAQVLQRLDEVQINYQIAPGGSGILVPLEKADQAKLDVANSDVLNGGVVGLEIFDQGNFTMTEFQQNVQLRRAMEGELARLIAQLNAVESAKVVLALPEKSVFIRDEQKPTAAVHLIIKDNGPADARVVRTILNLVSSGVPGLAIENVKLSDQFGNLYTYDLKDSYYDAENKNFQYKHNFEKYLENKVLDQLRLVTGDNGIKVKISAEINTEIQKIEENLVDPDLTAVVSEQSQQEQSSGGNQVPLGIPGVTSNSPEIDGRINGGLGNSDQNQRRSQTTNYENSRRIIQREISAGDLKRLTVSVLLDDKLQNITDDNDQQISNRVGWDDQELQEISSIVKNAVGFNENRGDLIEVRNISFAAKAQNDLQLASTIEPIQTELFFRIARFALAGILVLLVIFLVVRPLLKRFTYKAEEVVNLSDDYSAPSLASADRDEDQQLDLDFNRRTKTESDPQMILRYARENPETAVNTVRGWLRED